MVNLAPQQKPPACDANAVQFHSRKSIIHLVESSKLNPRKAVRCYNAAHNSTELIDRIFSNNGTGQSPLGN
jgi:hypothetical protein